MQCCLPFLQYQDKIEKEPVNQCYDEQNNGVELKVYATYTEGLSDVIGAEAKHEEERGHQQVSFPRRNGGSEDTYS